MSDDSIEYFVYCDDEIQGPLTRSQIKRLLRKGGINGETLCAIDGGSQWAPVSKLFSSQKSTKSPSSTIEKPGEGRVAYGAAISMFCGFLGVLCLVGVVLKQSWGFWFVAAAALLALASGVFTIMQGRNREPGPHDSPLALGGIAAGCIALMAGTWLPSTLHASAPKAEDAESEKTPAAVQDTTDPQVPATLLPPGDPPGGGIIDVNQPGGPLPPGGIIDTGGPTPPPTGSPATPATPEPPTPAPAQPGVITPPAPIAPPSRPLPGPGGVQPFPAPPVPKG